MSSEIEAFGRKWRRVWKEDECTLKDPTAEKWEQAWERLFSEKPEVVGGFGTLPFEDWGDAQAWVVHGKMLVSGYDGHEIWVPA